MDFVKGKCSGKNKKRFHVKSAILGFIKNVYTQLSGKDFKSVCFKKKKILVVSLVFVNMFRLDLQRTIKI